MVWFLILHIVKQKQKINFQKKCITKMKFKSFKKNLKQNKFYLLKKHTMEIGKKQI